ncbi:hypothetical protein JHD50_03790, partial [Sulfurimonas sp. MAG313]
LFSLQDKTRVETGSKEKNLKNLLNSEDTFPVFYLCDDTGSEETESFIQICHKHDIKVHLDLCPNQEDEELNLKKVLDFFERMESYA